MSRRSQDVRRKNSGESLCSPSIAPLSWNPQKSFHHPEGFREAESRHWLGMGYSPPAAARIGVASVDFVGADGEGHKFSVIPWFLPMHVSLLFGATRTCQKKNVANQCSEDC